MFVNRREVIKIAENTVEKLGIRILHVGINAAGAEDADRLAAEFQNKMGFVPVDKGLSLFTSGIIEIMKENGPGEKGHIALGCNNLEEAIECMAKYGVHVDKELTGKYDPDGKLRVAYLDTQIGGFAFHFKEYPKN